MACKKVCGVLPTLISRHRKEKLKKCSLRGLESRDDFRFFTYPRRALPELTGYCMLTLDAPPLSVEDKDFGLFLVDGTWRLAEKMVRSIPKPNTLVHRSLPSHFRTAYPRIQTGCSDPDSGLASIEALYLAFLLTGRCTEGLLDNYYWRDDFILKNNILDKSCQSCA